MTHIMRLAILLAIIGNCPILTHGQDSTVTKAMAESPLVSVRSEAFEPMASLAMIELSDDMQRIQLLASEPLVVDPVEVAFDDAGRMWVVEMRDYPMQVGESPTGRIRVLSDTDRDGRYDAAQVFAEKLAMPTGLALWKDGAVVTLAGELVFLRDTNQDGKSDKREQWLRGFTEDNEQLRANHPRLGPDGVWYIACGLRGGSIELGDHFASQTDSNPLQVGRRDIRFDSESGHVEAITGPAQFGLAFDSLGSRFFCSNRNPAVQVVFEQKDLSSNPLFGLVPPIKDVIPAGESSRVYPLVDAWTTSNLHSGQFTAACGVFLRRTPMKNSWQEIYACEPTGSLIKRVNAKRNGASFELIERAQESPEWLASRDEWFRPVNLALAPNNTIVVVDMHRAVIEHPRWVPEELKRRPDERWGNDRGRVFVVDGESRPFGEALSELAKQPLGQLSSNALVERLPRGGRWARETCTRLLLERSATEVVPQLNRLLTSWPRTEQMTSDTRIAIAQLVVALGGTVPFSELCASQDRELSEVVGLLRLAREAGQVGQELDVQLHTLALESPSVLFESLLCMAQRPRSSLPNEVMDRVVESDDPRMLIAAAGAVHEQPDRFLSTWLNALGRSRSLLKNTSGFVADAARKLAAGALKKNGSKRLLIHAVQESLHSDDSNAECLLAALAVEEALLLANRVQVDGRLSTRVNQLVLDVEQSNAIRKSAIRVLSWSTSTVDRELLIGLASGTPEPDLLEELLRGWARIAVDDASKEACDRKLIDLVTEGTPRERSVALTVLLESTNRIDKLAKELQKDAQTKNASLARLVGPTELKRLVSRSGGKTKDIFVLALSSLVNSDRVGVVAKYLPAAGRASDLGQCDLDYGRKLFEQHCATCHKIGSIGIDVGPDISDSRTKTPEQLLTSILDPSRVIDNNYFRSVVLTEDDQVIDGIITEETDEAVVVTSQGRKRTTIARSEIVEIKQAGVSLMPEGFESQLDPDAMTDLIAFIKGWRYEASTATSSPPPTR